jgi:hypothetical protein
MEQKIAEERALGLVKGDIVVNNPVNELLLP